MRQEVLVLLPRPFFIVLTSFAAIAQLVEHLFEEQGAEGSIPSRSTMSTVFVAQRQRIGM